MKIIITNTAALNTGDAAILEATKVMLQMAFGRDALFRIHDTSAAPARYYPETHFQEMAYTAIENSMRGRNSRRFTVVVALVAACCWRSWLGRAIAGTLPQRLRDNMSAFAEADLIVSAGGAYLVPHYRLAPKLFELLLALAFGKPLVLFTQSLGPFVGRNRILFRYALRAARLILVRDETSRRNLLDLGVRPSRIRICADAVFAICPQDIASQGRIPRIGASLNVAISARGRSHFSMAGGEARMERYVEAMAVLTYRLIIEKNARVTFVSTCQGAPEHSSDDSIVAERIVSCLPVAARASVTLDRSFHRPLELLDRLEEFDLVIATRMHAAILALCAGVPVVPIAHEFKTVELFRWLGFTEPIPDMETMTPDSLWRDFERIFGRWVESPGSLWHRVGGARQSALSAVDCLRRLVLVPS